MRDNTETRCSGWTRPPADAPSWAQERPLEGLPGATVPNPPSPPPGLRALTRTLAPQGPAMPWSLFQQRAAAQGKGEAVSSAGKACGCAG